MTERRRQLRIKLFELKRLKELEIGREITQVEIATVAGISERAISSWMNDNITRYDKDTLEKLCHFFDCGINELLELKPDQ